MCGKNLGSATFTTIGEQRQDNYALQPMSKQEFIEVVTAEQPAAPAYFGYDAMMNKKERATLESNLKRVLKPLPLERILKEQADGTRIVDVRDAADFAGAHLVDSLNISLDGKFATWAGTLLHENKHAKVILIAEPGTEHEAALRLGRIGTDNVIGYLEGGMGSLESRPELVATCERVTAKALTSLIAGDTPPLVIDVRGAKEWKAGHIEGSLNIPLGQLNERMREIPSDRLFAIVCRTGYRSSIAASLVLRAGLSNFLDLIGGMQAWNGSALPVKVLTKTSCQASK